MFSFLVLHRPLPAGHFPYEMLQLDTFVSNDDQEIRMARLGQNDSVKTNLEIKAVVIEIT